jgi:hypothetical protein
MYYYNLYLHLIPYRGVARNLHHNTYNYEVLIANLKILGLNEEYKPHEWKEFA